MLPWRPSSLKGNWFVNVSGCRSGPFEAEDAAKHAGVRLLARGWSACSRRSGSFRLSSLAPVGQLQRAQEETPTRRLFRSTEKTGNRRGLSDESCSSQCPRVRDRITTMRSPSRVSHRCFTPALANRTFASITLPRRQGYGPIDNRCWISGLKRMVRTF
jgi:hypothetical protein